MVLREVLVTLLGLFGAQGSMPPCRALVTSLFKTGGHIWINAWPRFYLRPLELVTKRAAYRRRVSALDRSKRRWNALVAPTKRQSLALLGLQHREHSDWTVKQRKSMKRQTERGKSKLLLDFAFKLFVLSCQELKQRIWNTSQVFQHRP